jgi:hypothetical protein
MLDREQFHAAINSMLMAGMHFIQTGNLNASQRLLGGVVTAAWELSRPDAVIHSVDIYEHVPDDLKRIMASLTVNVIVDGEGAPLMGYGEGRDHAGADAQFGGVLTTAQHNALSNVIDEQLKAHFGHLDLTKVTRMDELMVETTRETIDKQVEGFRDELDSLFETWGGGGETT